MRACGKAGCPRRALERLRDVFADLVVLAEFGNVRAARQHRFGCKGCGWVKCLTRWSVRGG